MLTIERSVTINAPIDRVFAVIADVESYPEFLNAMPEVTVERRTASNIIATFHLALMMPLRYTIKLTLYPPKKIAWSLVKGEMIKENKGAWEFQKLSGAQTHATYRISLDFGWWIPESVANNMIAAKLPETLDAFVQRCEGRQGRAPKRRKSAKASKGK